MITRNRNHHFLKCAISDLEPDFQDSTCELSIVLSFIVVYESNSAIHDKLSMLLWSKRDILAQL